jgi:hypothetical protein
MSRPSCTLNTLEILDTYFLENRARLLEIASFLDRLDRAQDVPKTRAISATLPSFGHWNSFWNRAGSGPRRSS